MLSCPNRLHDYLAFIATTCRLLVDLASRDSTELSLLPEFLVDNVVEIVGYLRRLNDDFIEVLSTGSSGADNEVLFSPSSPLKPLM